MASVVVLVESGNTVTGSVAVVAHWPAFAVNVYVPDVVLLTVAGLHVPVIPFVEVVGKTGAAVPLHIAATALNNGTVGVLTVTLNVADPAHCPALAVKVYVPDVVLLTVAGDHVPVMPLVEVVGKTGATEPLQIVPTGVNAGVMLELTVTDSVVPATHCCPAARVKV